MARAEWIFIVPDTGTVYKSNSRHFLEIFSQQAGERLPKATGVELIESHIQPAMCYIYHMT